MKSIIAAVIFVGGVATGCASLALPGPADGVGAEAAARRDGRPGIGSELSGSMIAATLLPTGASLDESLTLQLDRAAYTAVFRVVPGQGAMMIYPRPGFGAPDGYLFSGTHRVVTAGPGMSFVGSLNQMLPSSTLPPGTSEADFGPEYYLVVASGRPLRLDGALFGGGWQNPSAGAYPTMQWLVSETASEWSGATWASDYFVHWPGTIAASGQQGFVPMTCNGSRVWVDPARQERAMRALCGEGGLPPGPNVSTPDPSSPDPYGVVSPRRRQPASDGVRISSRQLEDPEGWEAARAEAASIRVPGGRILPPVDQPADAEGVAGPARRTPNGVGADPSAASHIAVPPPDPADGVGRPRLGATGSGPAAAGWETVEANRRRPVSDLMTLPAAGGLTEPVGGGPTEVANPADRATSGNLQGAGAESGLPRLRPGINLPPDSPVDAASDRPGAAGEDPLQPRLQPRFLYPMLRGTADPGRIGPGYQFPVDAPPPDPWSVPVEPATGMPAPALGIPAPPSRREPLPLEPEAPPPSAGDGSGSEVPRPRPDL